MSRFCTAPWVNISTDVNGSIRPCCRYAQPHEQKHYKMPWMKDGNISELYNSKEMQSLREAFIRGEEPSECNWCWSEEASGSKSFRQKYIERDYSYDTSNPLPQILDLKLSNTCNMKCRMCGPQASSAIAKEEGIINPYLHSNKILNTDSEDIFFNEWLPNIKELELTGGEPFFSKENKDLIFKISETKFAQNIAIKITTNGMFFDTKMMDNLSKFKLVEIPVSIDDIGKRLEYARGDADWKTVSKNILLMKKNYQQFDVSIYRTINNYNIYYLDELDVWAKENNITISNGVLHSPKELCIQKLPEFVKEEIVNKFGDSYKDIIDFMNNNISNNIDITLKMFYNKNKLLDEKRNQCFSSTFSEFAELMLWN